MSLSFLARVGFDTAIARSIPSVNLRYRYSHPLLVHPSSVLTDLHKRSVPPLPLPMVMGVEREHGWITIQNLPSKASPVSSYPL